MIKNQKQATNTKNKLAELIKDRNEYIAVHNQTEGSARYRLALNGFNAIIKDLEIQIDQFEKLSTGQFNCVRPHLHSFEEILIAARIAQGISHKQLADRLGIKEQQVQRYEGNEYNGASYTRIMEVAMALGINCKIEETWLMNIEKPIHFELPKGVTRETVESITEIVKKSHSILID